MTNPQPAKLYITCSWCGKVMGEKDGEGIEGETSSICDYCLGFYFPAHCEKIKAILKEEE